MANFEKKKKVVCVLDYFVPGYKAGGPIKTIDNMIRHLSDDFVFFIIARDRDIQSDTPYDGVDVDRWNVYGNAFVYYASPSRFSYFGIKKIMSEVDFDIIYLNSFFSPRATFFPLVCRKLVFFSGNAPLVIAPRGEFSQGALRIKTLKKSIYLFFVRAFDLYGGAVIWQASSEYEKADIIKVMNVKGDNVIIAPDLLVMNKEVPPNYGDYVEFKKSRNGLNIVFLSRVSPIKNLLYLIELLQSVTSNVFLDVYGPLEDTKYWGMCLAAADLLSDNVRFEYMGSVEPAVVGSKFSNYDLFAFPTFGENFGHVIFEALQVGTPVLVSDKTPWQPSDGNELNIIPLEFRHSWVEKIEEYSRFNSEELFELKMRAFHYAAKYYEDSSAVKSNLNLFLAALQG